LFWDDRPYSKCFSIDRREAWSVRENWQPCVHWFPHILLGPPAQIIHNSISMWMKIMLGCLLVSNTSIGEDAFTRTTIVVVAHGTWLCSPPLYLYWHW
jgi:hypothetical protein